MNIFAYGSLMFAPVWQRVVTGSYRSCAGRLRGFARRRIRGEAHPALLRHAPDSATEGIVYLGVSMADLAALDAFEDAGAEYARVEVSVRLADGALLPAWTYLYLHPERVEDIPWEADRFEAEGLQDFLETYGRDHLPGGTP